MNWLSVHKKGAYEFQNARTYFENLACTRINLLTKTYSECGSSSPDFLVSRTITTYLKRQQYLKQFLTNAKRRKPRFDKHKEATLPLNPPAKVLFGPV